MAKRPCRNHSAFYLSEDPPGPDSVYFCGRCGINVNRDGLPLAPQPDDKIRRDFTDGLQNSTPSLRPDDGSGDGSWKQTGSVKK
jgi:hypothetical protein